MTTEKTTHVVCDGEDCNEYLIFPTNRVKTAEREARIEHGWSCHWKGHYCPDCNHK